MNTRSIPPGGRFGRYIIDHVRGSGTFGVVYAARREDLPRLVALKVLHAELARSPEVVRRFKVEAHTISELRHPHIVDVHDVGALQGVPFLAMELLDGETLRARLEREGRLPLNVALDLLLPIFSAVSAVHARGVVHRDIKPDNIVLAATLLGRLHPKLLDFGVAKVRGDGPGLTRTGVAIGTPYYMSPEQAEEAREVDAASDQWALAALLYRCVTGAHPFEGRSVVKILHAIIEDAPPPPSTLLPSCPAAVERALLRALSKAPAERFPSVRAFGMVLLPFSSRRTQEDWRDEFVDTEAATGELDPPPSTGPAPRPQTRQGPTFQALMNASPVGAAPALYEDDVRTAVNDRTAAHDTVPSDAPAAPPVIHPIAPLGLAPSVAAVAVPPPPVTQAGTLSMGAHALKLAPKPDRTRRRVVLAGVLAFASVLASAVVTLDANQRARTFVATITRLPPRRVTQPAPPSPRAPPAVEALPPAAATGSAAASEHATSHHRRGSSRHARDDRDPAVRPVEAEHEGAGIAPSERLSDEGVREVMRAARGDVERCAGGRTGQLVVSVTVTREGVADPVAISGGMELSDHARSCVLDAVRALRFPRTSEGSRRVPHLYMLTTARRAIAAGR